MRQLLVVLWVAIFSDAVQVREPDVIRRVFKDTDSERGGLWITNHARGPDMAIMKFTRLEPNIVYAIHLSESARVGSTSSVFAGQFESDATGSGSFSMIIELCHSYLTANQGLENEQGIARSDDLGVRPGLLGEGANTIPLTYFRIYQGRSTVGVQSVFGT